MNITVLGAGSWGTTLAILLAEKGFPVTLWAHRPEFAKELQEKRENFRYLKGIRFPDNLLVTNDESAAASNAKLIVVATPAQAMRETLERIRHLDFKDTIFVNVAKGIEVHSDLRMSEVIEQVLTQVPDENVAILYGPSHAEEVSLKQPTTVVVSSHSMETARFVQDTFMTPMFRVYVNSDVVGVEVAGSVKNVMAIAAGIADGLGYGDNAKAAIITRGLAEISRLAMKLGANPLTFSGLAGIGDLIVTCASRHSRNRRVGELIGKGMKLEDILKDMVMVAEGIETTKAVMELSKKLGIEMPITQAVYEMLFEDKPVKQAVLALMTRDPKNEMH
ncbi:MAG: NAD(P)H-dependent glycerol-3-phosphate dehydrogenase [Chlorobiales bacterium]|nr:NAD(P)H-dependent glycerol-3-phosphate dehydrogenase [Chlorobiales bacterium]